MRSQAQIAAELEAAGWNGPAADLRDGLSIETVLERLRSIGEGESSAADILLFPEDS